MSKLIDIQLDDTALPSATKEVERERRAAIVDLLEENSFALPGGENHEELKLALGIRDRRLVLAICTSEGDPLEQYHLSLGSFRQIVKDYYQICESYFDALKTMAPTQIETIDMARRGIHNEGARVLVERLEGKVTLDEPTARRLFTLICVLHFGA